jgi:hypothetical protein
VDVAFGRTLRPEQYNFAPVILTCDPAWEGDDELVIGKRQGLLFTVLRTLPKNDNDVWVANELARLEDEHQADAVFIDGGYGTGIVSAGRTMGRDHWHARVVRRKPNDGLPEQARGDVEGSARLAEGRAAPSLRTRCCATSSSRPRPCRAWTASCSSSRRRT